MVLDGRLHNVPVKLKIRDWWQLEDRLIELNELRAWLDQITEWQPDMYELRFHSSGSQCVAWFADERHAMLCALKYS
jgi:hypothetical protein